MNHFVEKLHLKELAEEDIFFAKRDAALIKALHEKKLATFAECGEKEGRREAERFENRFASISDQHKHRPLDLLRAYRALLDDVWNACKRHK